MVGSVVVDELWAMLQGLIKNNQSNLVLSRIDGKFVICRNDMQITRTKRLAWAHLHSILGKSVSMEVPFSMLHHWGDNSRIEHIEFMCWGPYKAILITFGNKVHHADTLAKLATVLALANMRTAPQVMANRV